MVQETGKPAENKIPMAHMALTARLVPPDVLEHPHHNNKTRTAAVSGLHAMRH